MRTTRRQTIIGTVVSDRMNKTVVVEVETLKQHPQYKKYIRTRKRYKAHDEENKCELGDVVRCMETRPLSKDKRWRVEEVLRKRYVSTAEIIETDELVMKKERPARKPEEAEAPVEQAAETESNGRRESEGGSLENESAENRSNETTESGE